jgi:hypothetical protein
MGPNRVRSAKIPSEGGGTSRARPSYEETVANRERRTKNAAAPEKLRYRERPEGTAIMAIESRTRSGVARIGHSRDGVVLAVFEFVRGRGIRFARAKRARARQRSV